MTVSLCAFHVFRLIHTKGGRNATKRLKNRPWILFGATALIVIVGVLYFLMSSKHNDVSAVPFIRINNMTYTYDPSGYKTDELPQEYRMIGEVTSVALSAYDARNGYASGLKIGEQIFQSSERNDEVFVYTTLFSANKTYRYVRFTSKNAN